MEADSVGSGVDDRALDACFVLRLRDEVVVDGRGVDDAFGTCGDDSLAINSFDGVESLLELSLLLELIVSTFLPLTEAENFEIVSSVRLSRPTELQKN